MVDIFDPTIKSCHRRLTGSPVLVLYSEKHPVTIMVSHTWSEFHTKTHVDEYTLITVVCNMTWNKCPIKYTK